MSKDTGVIPARLQGKKGGGNPHRARRDPRLCTADHLGLLGRDGLYADRRHIGRNDPDPRLPARALFALVPHPP